MSKRRLSARDKSLTGGTGDVKPQLLSQQFTQTGVDATFSVAVPMPIPRVQGTQAQKATIIEVLKVWFYFNGTTDLSFQAWAYLATTSLVGAGITTRTLVVAMENDLLNPKTIAAFAINSKTAGTDLSIATSWPIEIDLSDGAGNGILIATDNLFFEGSSDNSVAAFPFGFRMMYRTYDAGILEYVGIVQSQQT